MRIEYPRDRRLIDPNDANGGDGANGNGRGNFTGEESYRTGYLKLKSVLHDRATGLPAFPILFDTLRAALDRRKQIGVLHVELVDLELVESLYGWQVFDQVVQRVAAALRQVVAQRLPVDSLLSLSGVAGDRFVVFVMQRPDGREVDADTLASLSGLIQQSVGDALSEGAGAGLGVQATNRVGHAFLSLNPFYRFERRVYSAIADARDSVERRERRRERSWGEELAEIIRDANVRAYLQPVLRLDSREIIGFEALVRGPSQSMFEAPQAMFALSERLGSAAELDRVCMVEALRASATVDWRGKLFLNLLPGAVSRSGDGMRSFRERVEASGFDPSNMVIELSERWGDDNRAGLVAAMEELREGGFQVALDDAGTGRDSRELVERTRPRYVKLDVSLVRDVHANLIKQEVLHSLVRIAAGVGAEVIAEGVENEGEAATLGEAGVDLAQGFLFAVPAPAATVLRRSGGARA